MKLVLSRKGFDSQYGEMASPILPDGRMIALPIPSRGDPYTFDDINYSDVDTGKLISDLSGRRLHLDDRVHLDPDLDRPVGLRLDGWRPALGQTLAAQGHLRKCGVGSGDVFIFFGWFRRVELHNGAWRYERSAPDLHMMFGWLEVEQVLPIVTHRDEALAQYPWIANHPHVVRQDWYTDKRNSLYVARPSSQFAPEAQFGAGRFKSFQKDLQLTLDGQSRSVWSLPAWFAPSGRPALSYHENPNRWTPVGDRVKLQSVAKGQEFVADGAIYPDLESWVATIIRKGRS